MTTSQTYSPEVMPRRGEVTAWALAAFSLLGLVFLSTYGGVSWIALFFVLFLFFSATSISLGNWMDRHTTLIIDDDGVSFTNGLRQVRLGWKEVEKIRVTPAQWGEAVHVMGADAHFTFSTLGEMRYEGTVRARTGFAKGTDIKNALVRRCGLRENRVGEATEFVRE